MRLGVLALVIGFAAFGVIYYQDQYVDAGPSLVGRQTEAAEQAVRKAPGNIGARLALATAYRTDKRGDDALEQYDEILKADTAHRTALMGRGSVLMAKGDLKDAAKTYRKITGTAVKGEFARLDPQLQEAHYYLGSIALTEGRTKEAIKELTAALKIERSDSDALYLLGVARLKEGSPKLAVDSLNEALRYVPTGWCEPFSQLVVAYGKLAQVPQRTYAAAMADFCQKKPTEATRLLKTLTAGPVKVDAMMGLGLIAETGSNHPEAVAWYKKVLTVDAANINAISALSRLGVAPPAGPKSPSPAAIGSSTKQGRG